MTFIEVRIKSRWNESIAAFTFELYGRIQGGQSGTRSERDPLTRAPER